MHFKSSFLFSLFAIVTASPSLDDFEDDPSDIFSSSSCSDLTAQAGEPILIKFNTTKTATTGAKGAWDSFRLSFSKHTDAEESIVTPICVYSNCMPIDTTAVTVTIDPAWGPPGDYYHFAVSFFDDADLDIPPNERYNESYIGYVNGWNGLNVTGMTGRFYDWESNPPGSDEGYNWPTRLPMYPCKAYQCARECVDKYYEPGHIFHPSEVLEKMQACADACPGAKDPLNNCPNVGGVAATIADGVDTNRVPEGCQTKGPYLSDQPPETTPTADSSTSDGGRNSGVRMTSMSKAGYLGIGIASLMLGVVF